MDELAPWYCPKCKDLVVYKKQMFIYKAPKILIVALRRYKTKGQKNNMYNIVYLAWFVTP